MNPEIEKVAQRLIVHAKQKTTDSVVGVFRNPVSTYVDEKLFLLEKSVLFRKWPLLACLSADLPDNGSYKTFDEIGIPILLCRDQQGRVRAFFNSCRHRGGRLAEGCGRKKNFSCPYHSWIYGNDGVLKKVFLEDAFGEVAKKDYNLIEFPCEESYGLVFLIPELKGELNVKNYLGGLGPQLSEFTAKKLNIVKTGMMKAEANWKLAQDGYGEGYHFAAVHGKSFPDACVNIMSYDRYGEVGKKRHHRIGFPYKNITELEATLSLTESDILAKLNLVYFVYPNTNFFIFGEHVFVMQMFPGKRVGSCQTCITMYTSSDIDSAEKKKQCEEVFNFLFYVIQDEDYNTCNKVQKNIEAGLMDHVLFGENEAPLQDVHRHYREDTKSFL